MIQHAEAGNKRGWPVRPGLVATLLFATPLAAHAAQEAQEDGATLYRQACAACHGADGRGVDRSLVLFEEELPDFTDCSFASREPHGDWVAVAHEGGPLRGFSRMMPAFGGAISLEALDRIVSHVKAMCKDKSWPGGELNLPRTLYTEKAFPEDEWVLETVAALDGPASLIHTLIYEKRFGPRTQVEIALPFGFRRIPGVTSGDVLATGVGDMALGLKHAFAHNAERGYILSAMAELKVPTGNVRKGFGTGDNVAEAFLAFAKLFPADAFVQLQGGAERALTSGAGTEVFWSAALGKTFTQGQWGRAWSPMIEVLGVHEDGEDMLLDIAPQLHVSLNQRQHVMLTLGPRIPLNGSGRRRSFAVNLLWDWFDGGLFDGW